MKLYLLSFIILFTIGYTQAQTPTLWGLTYGSGLNFAGTIFSFNTGTNQPVASYSFGSGTDGVRPNGTMLEATDGYFYGTTTLGGSETAGTIFRYDVTTGAEKVVHSFYTNANDGEDPGYALIQVNDSMLYGVTEVGGSNADGIIFSYNILSGLYSIDYVFGGGTDAANPQGPLLQLNDSLLYGLSNGGGSDFYGTIYKYNMLTGEERVVYSFGSSDTDGRFCLGGLIKANDNLLYGMTYAGGKNNSGTIFSFNPATGVETNLHSFGGFPNGVSPYSSFIPVGDSDLYSTTYEGGNHSVGTIFKYNIYTKVTTQLYEFGGTGDGQYPYYGPLFLDGNLLYGMTQMGGANGYGIIFTYNIALDTEIDVYDFASSAFGDEPKGGFVEYNTVTAVKKPTVNNGKLSIYPNPTSNQLTVESGQLTVNAITIINMLGQIVYKSPSDDLGAKKQTIDVSALPDGLYFITVNTNAGMVTQKVVVQK